MDAAKQLWGSITTTPRPKSENIWLYLHAIPQTLEPHRLKEVPRAKGAARLAEHLSGMHEALGLDPQPHVSQVWHVLIIPALRRLRQAIKNSRLQDGLAGKGACCQPDHLNSFL